MATRMQDSESHIHIHKNRNHDKEEEEVDDDWNERCKSLLQKKKKGKKEQIEGKKLPMIHKCQFKVKQEEGESKQILRSSMLEGGNNSQDNSDLEDDRSCRHKESQSSVKQNEGEANHEKKEKRRASMPEGETKHRKIEKRRASMPSFSDLDEIFNQYDNQSFNSCDDDISKLTLDSVPLVKSKSEISLTSSNSEKTRSDQISDEDETKTAHSQADEEVEIKASSSVSNNSSGDRSSNSSNKDIPVHVRVQFDDSTVFSRDNSTKYTSNYYPDRHRICNTSCWKRSLIGTIAFFSAVALTLVTVLLVDFHLEERETEKETEDPMLDSDGPFGFYDDHSKYHNHIDYENDLHVILHEPIPVHSSMFPNQMMYHLVDRDQVISANENIVVSETPFFWKVPHTGHVIESIMSKCFNLVLACDLIDKEVMSDMLQHSNEVRDFRYTAKCVL